MDKYCNCLTLQKRYISTGSMGHLTLAGTFENTCSFSRMQFLLFWLKVCLVETMQQTLSVSLFSITVLDKSFMEFISY